MSDFEALDLDEIARESERVNSENQNSSDDFLQKFVKLPEREGYVLMRFLPRKKGGKFFCATRLHTLNNPATNQKRQYHCPRNLDENGKWKGDCIICKYYSDLWQKSMSLTGKAQEDLQNKAREIKPNERYYYNVIVRQEKDPKTNETLTNVGPKIYSCGKQVHGKIFRAMHGDKSSGEAALGDISDLNVGRDFRLVKKVVKSGTREFPNYDFSKFEDKSVAGTKEDIDNWSNNLNDLSNLRKVKTEEELRHALRVHLGMVRDEAQEDNSLDEFRAASGLGGTSSVSVQGNEPVREDLLTPEPEVSGESDTLADDEFMKELASM